MSATPDVGVVLGSTQPPRELVAAACRADRAGFHDIWVGEDYFFTGGVAAAACLLANVEVPVGIGIVSAVLRHPALLAMELATLEEIYPGRLRGGLGLGVPECLDQLGLRPRSGLAAVRDTLRATRALMAGETLTIETETFSAEGIALEHPPARVPPLYIGASGPKALRQAGAEADGTVLSVLAGAEYVRWACARLAEGAAADNHRVVVYALCAVADDGDEARELVREGVATYSLIFPRNPLSEVQGFVDEAEELAALGLEAATPLVPQAWLRDLTVAGTPAECAARIRALGEAGAHAVALIFPDDHIEDMIDRVAHDVLPALRGGDR